MSEAVDDGSISVPAAAELLGLQPHTLYRLMDAGHLGQVVTEPGRHRVYRLRRREVDDFIAPARIKPGELRHLHPTWGWDRYG